MEVYTSLKDLRDIQLKYTSEEQTIKAMSELMNDKYLGRQMNTTFVESYISDMDTYVNTRINQKISTIINDKIIYQAKPEIDI